MGKEYAVHLLVVEVQETDATRREPTIAEVAPLDSTQAGLTILSRLLEIGPTASSSSDERCAAMCLAELLASAEDNKPAL